MPVSAHYIFIRSPGLASDTEVIKCSGAIRAALSALKQRQKGCQTHQKQEQKHLISEGASWELPYNWVPSTHNQLGQSRETSTEGEKQNKTQNKTKPKPKPNQSRFSPQDPETALFKAA